MAAKKFGLVLDLAGVVGAGLMALSDLVLLFTSVERSRYDFLEIATHIPEMRVMVGDYLGLVGVPFVLVGLYRVYEGLRPAGPWLSLPPVLLLAYGYLLGAVFHHGVSMTMIVARQDSLGGAAASELATILLVPLGIAFGTIVVAGSTWLFVALITGRTGYPRWMAWTSPLTVVLLFRLLVLFGPPWMVGALVPAGPNLAMVVFFSVAAGHRHVNRPPELVERAV